MIKRIIASVLVVLLAIPMLSGCSINDDIKFINDKANQATTALSETENVINSDVITLKVCESILGSDEWILKAGEKFSEKYPNIKVEYVNAELNEDFNITAIDGSSGIEPDLFAASHVKLSELVIGGYVLPTVNPNTISASVFGVCSSALTYNGIMYGYPISTDTYALFYNKDLISEDVLPKTWDELYNWCEEFNNINPDKYGFVMDVTSMYYAALFATANGSNLFGSSETDTSASCFNTSDTIKGMELFQKLRDIVPINSADLNTGYADEAFYKGNAAMYLTGSQNIRIFTGAGLNFGITTVPALTDGGTPAVTLSETRGIFVSTYSDNPNEAALFGEFLISEEMQKLRYDITGALPSVVIPLDNEHVIGLIKQLCYAYPIPTVLEMAELKEYFDSACRSIWDGADVKTELDALNTAIIG